MYIWIFKNFDFMTVIHTSLEIRADGPRENLRTNGVLEYLSTITENSLFSSRSMSVRIKFQDLFSYGTLLWPSFSTPVVPFSQLLSFQFF